MAAVMIVPGWAPRNHRPGWRADCGRTWEDHLIDEASQHVAEAGCGPLIRVWISDVPAQSVVGGFGATQSGGGHEQTT